MVWLSFFWIYMTPCHKEEHSAGSVLGSSSVWSWTGTMVKKWLKVIILMYFTDQLQSGVDWMLARLAQPTDIWSRKSPSNLHQMPPSRLSHLKRTHTSGRCEGFLSGVRLKLARFNFFATKCQFLPWTMIHILFWDKWKKNTPTLQSQNENVQECAKGRPPVPNRLFFNIVQTAFDPPSFLNNYVADYSAK